MSEGRVQQLILPARQSKCAAEAKRALYAIEASMSPLERAQKALDLGRAAQAINDAK